MFNTESKPIKNIRDVRHTSFENLSDLKVISIILSEGWKTKAFIFIAKSRKWVTGYELSRRYNQYFPKVYDFLEKMVNFGVFRHPIEGNERRREVLITDYGLKIYSIIEVILNLTGNNFLLYQ